MDELLWAEYCDSASDAAYAGDYQKAENAWRLAWEQAQLLPDTDPRQMMTLEYFADALCLQKKYIEAEPLLITLIGVKTKLMGGFHAKVAATHNTMAGLYYALCKWDQAEGHCKRALEINEKLLGTANPDVAMILQNLGMVHHAQKRYKEAEVAYLRALDIVGKIFDKDHPESANIAEHYAALLEAMGRKQEAKDCTKTMVLPLIDRLVRTVGEEAQQPAPTNTGFTSKTLQGIEKDPRRANQCLYRIKPLPVPEKQAD